MDAIGFQQEAQFQRRLSAPLIIFANSSIIWNWKSKPPIGFYFNVYLMHLMFIFILFHKKMLCHLSKLNHYYNFKFIYLL